MFHSSSTYKHKNCLDMKIFVHKVMYRGNDYFKVKLSYITPYSMFGPETKKIYRKDFWLWSVV